MLNSDSILWDPSGQDQDLFFTPDGTRVVSTEFFLEDPDYASGSAERYLASGTATVDPLSVGLTAPAGASQAFPRRVYVTDATTNLTASQGAEIVHAESGLTEPVEIKAVGGNDAASGSFVTLALPLHERTFPSGSILRGKTITVSVPGSIVSDEDLFKRQDALRFFLRWRAGSVTRTASRLVSFDRTESDISLEEVERSFRQMFVGANRGSLSYDILMGLISQAKEEVDLDMRRAGRDIKEYQLGNYGNKLVLWKTCYLVGISPYNPDGDRLERFTNEAETRYWKLFSGMNGGAAPKGTKKVSRDDETDKKPTRLSPFASASDRRKG